MPFETDGETDAGLPGAPPTSRQKSIRPKKVPLIFEKASSIPRFPGTLPGTGSDHKGTVVLRGSSSGYRKAGSARVRTDRDFFADFKTALLYADLFRSRRKSCLTRSSRAVRPKNSDGFRDAPYGRASATFVVHQRKPVLGDRTSVLLGYFVTAVMLNLLDFRPVAQLVRALP